jgi:hypothetical protein
MFWAFFFTLIVGDIVAIILFPLIIAVLTFPLHLFANRENEKSFFALGLVFYIKICLWYLLVGLWTAFCALLTHNFTSDQNVTHDWIYWLFAIFAAGAPLGFFLSSIQKNLSGNPLRIEYFTMISFGIFSVWPELAKKVFGWILWPVIE